MKLVYFRTGQHLTLDAVKYRIERILESDDVVLERVSDLALIRRTKSELLTFHAEGKLRFSGTETPNTEEDNRVAPMLSSYDEDLQKEALRRHEYIKAACIVLGVSPCVKGLDDVIQRVAIQTSDHSVPSGVTVYRWWKRWTESGYDITSLISVTKKPRNDTYLHKLNPLFHDVIDEVVLRMENNTYQDAYDVFCSRVRSHNAHRPIPHGIPSRATFYRMLKVLDPYLLMTARKGKRAADKFFRTTGKGVVSTRILERVEIDHTPIDLMVVNEKTGVVEGRPSLTFIIDHYSRMPLGFYVGFEPPSALSVMRALRHAILPKSYVREQFPDIKKEWPAFGIPSVLVCDNGTEFHADQLRRMCQELNIELFFCPKHQPQYKGVVERFLGTFNRDVCQKIAGTTYSNINERGDYDAVKHASITLEKLNSYIHEWLINVYSEKPHTGISKPPIKMWKEGLDIVEPLLPASREQLDLILTNEHERQLNHEGVQILRLQYNSPELGQLRRRLSGKGKVKLRVDPENMGSVWVFDELEGSYFNVPCTDEYADGLSMRQHKHILQSRTDTRVAADPVELQEHKVQLIKKLHESPVDKRVRARTKLARLSSPALKKKAAFNKKSPITPPASDQPLELPSGMNSFDIEWGDE